MPPSARAVNSIPFKKIIVNNIQKNLIKKGIITKEQIDIAQEKYKEQTEQKILAGLKRRR